jgi:TonB family protein
MLRHLICAGIFLAIASFPASALQAPDSTSPSKPPETSSGAPANSSTQWLSNLARLGPNAVSHNVLGGGIGVQVLSQLTPVQSEVMKNLMPGFVKTTRQRWRRLIPEEAHPPVLKKGEVTIEFTLHANGTVSDMRLAHPSGDVALDRAAWGAISGSKYEPFLLVLDVPSVRLRFPFTYNEITTVLYSPNTPPQNRPPAR